jgi:AcrR family transcriptional regulator
MPDRKPGKRRVDSAAETRQLILDAALALFDECGYGATTINAIAGRAGVAVATVYTSVGGKPAVLAEIINAGTRDPEIELSLQRVRQAPDGPSAVREIVGGNRAVNQAHWTGINLLLAVGPTDDIVGAAVAQATADYRASLAVGAGRLESLGALAPHVDQTVAADVLWFFLGLGSWHRLIEDCGWDWDRAENWLRDTIGHSLLG